MNRANNYPGKLAITLLAVACGLCSTDCKADIKTLKMPGAYAGFAFQPESGDLVALDGKNGKAVYFRGSDLNSGKAEPASSLRVGSQPVSVFYKDYQNVGYYAVVCSRDSHMYLIKSDDFSLAAKIKLNQAGVRLVTGSQNKDDPFLYYCFGNGHDCATGAVSLRDFKNKGGVFDDSMDCAISAQGNIAYRRGPFSPSGFESLIRTNELEAEIPKFDRLFYDHDSTMQYVPDPFNRFTAAGSDVYTRSLEQNVALLDFIPHQFFHDRPLIIGVKKLDPVYAMRDPSSNAVQLRAGSYNTFSSIGDWVTLPSADSKPDDKTGRGFPSSWTREKSLWLFADAKRDQVVVALKSRVHLVPLAEFNLPEEPFLFADLHGADDITVGRETKFKLVPRDERVEVLIEDLPAGIKRNGLNFFWTPSMDSVGSTDLSVTLKHGEIQRTLNFDLQVKYPGVKLPFAPSDIAVSTNGEHAVIWEGIPPDRFGRSRPVPQQGPLKIAVVQLENGDVKAERKIASPIDSAMLIGNSCLVWNTKATPKFDVLKLDSLDRAATIATAGPIIQIESAGKLILVRTTEQIEAYETQQWKKVRVFQPDSFDRRMPNRNGEISLVGRHGIYLKNLLYDFELKPKLLPDRRGLPTLAGATSGGDAAFYKEFEQKTNTRVERYNPSATETAIVGASPIPGSSGDVQLVRSLNTIKVPGSMHTNRKHYELSVSSTGDRPGRQVLLRKSMHGHANLGIPSIRPRVKATNRTAVVVHENTLYRWPIPEPIESPQQLDGVFSFIPKQSVLAIDPQGTTLLKHATTGGQSPVKYSIPSPYSGLKIDEKSGTITVDNASMLKEAEKALEKSILDSRRGNSLVDTLRDWAGQRMETAALMLGRRAKGLPVAIPIRVNASDDNLANASLQYFLIAEVPARQFMSKMRKLDEEREKMLEQGHQRRLADALARPQNPSQFQEAETIEFLARKVAALEDRIDLLTRQMSQLLEEQEKR